ncbi:PREDICTED: uncharacterized protein LOC109165445 [Ipomoea nil]|uniref:uncharacterized protein LOC109165445 n=1 Tax=Ipomoea nil TaxID=35883 RepID=UPI0009015053|nr:PREDICTED: uncharacterized protein LOC109165445 [Ipomoea nil]
MDSKVTLSAMFVVFFTIAILRRHRSQALTDEECFKTRVIFNFGDSKSDTGGYAAVNGQFYGFGSPLVVHFLATPIVCAIDDDDKEYIDGITDLSYWASAYALQRLFAKLLTSSSISRPRWCGVSFGNFLRRMHIFSIDVSCKIQSLRDFPEMPIRNESSMGLMKDMLIAEELVYDKESLKTKHNGKTLVWRTLSSKIRRRGDIVLKVFSSEIASLLLPGGRTAHSRFAIPFSLSEDSTCNISFAIRGSDVKTFGGNTVVLGGDFRQIILVIPKATRLIVVATTINSSYLWTNCKVLRFTKNLRLWGLASVEDRQTVDWFSKWIADIGDGITRVVTTNIDHSIGLCNDMCFFVTRLSDRIVEARIVNETNEGTKVLIPRMSLTPSDTRLPFKFQPFSRVTHRLNGLKVLALDKDGQDSVATTNVFYKDAFNNV